MLDTMTHMTETMTNIGDIKTHARYLQSYSGQNNPRWGQQQRADTITHSGHMADIMTRGKHNDMQQTQ